MQHKPRLVFNCCCTQQHNSSGNAMLFVMLSENVDMSENVHVFRLIFNVNANVAPANYITKRKKIYCIQYIFWILKQVVFCSVAELNFYPCEGGGNGVAKAIPGGPQTKNLEAHYQKVININFLCSIQLACAYTRTHKTHLKHWQHQLQQRQNIFKCKKKKK